MKINRCFSTLTCIDASVADVVSYAKKHSMSGVEIRLDAAQTVYGTGLEGAADIRALFEDAGIAITDLATGVNVTGLGDLDAEMRKAEGCVKLASAVGASAIRIFVGGHQPKLSVAPKEDIGAIAAFVRDLCDYAAEYGIAVWAETHSSHSTAASMKALSDRVNRKNFAVIWDVLHSIEFCESPEDSVKLLSGGLLAHVHLKDARPSDDPDASQYIHTSLGAGTFPLAKVLSLLDEASYDGYLSLEYELPWRPELRGCYADTDAILDAYNAWLDAARNK